MENKDKQFTYKQKINLSKKISLLKKKKDLLFICNLIKNDAKKNNPGKIMPVTNNENGIFLNFHNLQNDTYTEIEQYVNAIIMPSLSASSEECQDFIPYSQDEYPLQNNLGQKLKYSNREKNILKRKQYDKIVTESNNSASEKLSELSEKEKDKTDS